MSAGRPGPELGPHIGEDAELYALGALAPHERAQVEAHAAACATCAAAVSTALLVAAALDEAVVEPAAPPPQLGARIARSARTGAPPSRWQPFLAAAATVALALGLGGGIAVQRSLDAQQVAADSTVLSTLATSHFLHVSLTARAPDAPVAKAIYAHDGSWLLVVVDRADCRCRVAVRGSGGEEILGSPSARGSTSTLFARNAPLKATSVALLASDGSIIADAPLVYPRE